MDERDGVGGFFSELSSRQRRDTQPENPLGERSREAETHAPQSHPHRDQPPFSEDQNPNSHYAKPPAPVPPPQAMSGPSDDSWSSGVGSFLDEGFAPPQEGNPQHGAIGYTASTPQPPHQSAHQPPPHSSSPAGAYSGQGGGYGHSSPSQAARGDQSQGGYRRDQRGNQGRDSRNNNRRVAREIPGLPQNLEAERSVLGAVLVRNEALDEVRESGLRTEDFYREAHGIIFQSACDLSEKREPVDLVTLTALLRDRDQFDGVGGTTFLTTLFEDGFSVGNATSYGKIVREKAILRRMIETCQGVVTDAMAGVEDAEEFVDHVESQIFEVANTSTTKSFDRLSQVLMGNIQSIEELALNKSDVVGLKTGFNRFDYVTSGLQPGQVMILAARPGMGKTSWLLSAIQHAAVVEKKTCAVFSLEMGKEELGIRFLSGLSRIDSRSLKTGKLSDGDWKRLLEAADRLAKAKIFIDDSGALTAMDVRARCRRLKAQHKSLDLIVVDYLQLMKGSNSKSSDGSREREIAEISRATKQLAKELSVPIIMLSQLNRGVEARQDKRPMLADLRESGSIEQDADIVCFIHRDDYYNKESEEKGIAELIIAKNRAGEQASCRMAWHGQYTLFANLPEDEADTPISPSRPEKGDVFL